MLFLTEKESLSYTFLLKNGTPFTYLELCIPFNCCKCTKSLNPSTRTFSRLFHRYIMHLKALLGLFIGRKDKFPYHFYILQTVKSHLFIYLKPEKGTPFRAEPSCIGRSPGNKSGLPTLELLTVLSTFG